MFKHLAMIYYGTNLSNYGLYDYKFFSSLDIPMYIVEDPSCLKNTLSMITLLAVEKLINLTPFSLVSPNLCISIVCFIPRYIVITLCFMHLDHRLQFLCVLMLSIPSCCSRLKESFPFIICIIYPGIANNNIDVVELSFQAIT